MNKEKASKLWKMIQEAGDYLQGQLLNKFTYLLVGILDATYCFLTPSLK